MTQDELQQALAEFRTKTRQARIQNWTVTLILTSFFGFVGYTIAAPYVKNLDVFTDGTFTSTIASGNNAVAVSTNGARIDFGAGADDYASSTGARVEFAGRLATLAAMEISTNQALYFDGTSRSVGLSFDGASNIFLLGNSAFSPNTTLNNNLGSTSKKWSTAYIDSVIANTGLFTDSVVGSTVVTSPLSLQSSMNAATASSTVSAILACAGTSLDADDLLFKVGQSGSCSTARFTVDAEGDTLAAGSLGLATRKHWINTAPTIASGGCTSPSVVSGADTAVWLVTIGTSCTGVSTINFTMPTSSRVWHCWAISDDNAKVVRQLYTGSATTANFQNFSSTTGVAADWTAGQAIQFGCTGGGG